MANDVKNGIGQRSCLAHTGICQSLKNQDKQLSTMVQTFETSQRKQWDAIHGKTSMKVFMWITGLVIGALTVTSVSLWSSYSSHIEKSSTLILENFESLSEMEQERMKLVRDIQRDISVMKAIAEKKE